MNYEDFDKLKVMYTQLIELVCRGKEADTEDENMDCFFKMFQIVRACLEFSPYTHFYTQVLIDLIVKTYNFKTYRTDLLFKSQIGVFIENSKYSPKELYEQIEENQYTIELIFYEWTKKIDKVSDKKHKEYMEYFYTIRDLLINNFMEKKADLKERLELISKYSNNSLVRNLSVPEKLYLYEAKRVFDEIVKRKSLHTKKIAVDFSKTFVTKVSGTSKLILQETRGIIQLTRRNGKNITSKNCICISDDIRDKFIEDCKATEKKNRYAINIKTEEEMFNSWRTFIKNEYIRQYLEVKPQ